MKPKTKLAKNKGNYFNSSRAATVSKLHIFLVFDTLFLSTEELIFGFSPIINISLKKLLSIN